MKRDFDLIREILIQIEESAEESMALSSLNLCGFDNMPEMLNYHLKIMAEAGLIKVIPPRYIEDTERYASMLWGGHEFLDSARDSTVWQKAKNKLSTSVVSVSMAVLVDVLKEEAKQYLGLK